MNYKEEINKRGLKQRWIALQMNVSHEVLNKWVNGKVDFPMNRQDELKKILQ